jgi:hypothetical protein
VKRTRFVTWLGRASILVLLVIAAVVVAGNGAEWLEEISEQSWQPDPFLLILSSALLFLSLWLTPFGWLMMCRYSGCTAGSGEIRGVWFTSQLGRYIPGKIWLLAGRAGYLKSKGLSPAGAAAVPFFELLYTAAATGLIAAAVALFTPDFIASGILRTAAVCSGGALLLLPLLGGGRRFLCRIRYGSDRQTNPAGVAIPDTALSIKVLGLFTLLWIARGLSLYLWLSAMGVPGRGIWACIAAAPLSWLAGYIVFLVPGGIGVREAAAVAMIAGPGETGPILAAIIGQRVLLSVMELTLAAVHARTIPLFRRKSS